MMDHSNLNQWRHHAKDIIIINWSNNNPFTLTEKTREIGSGGGSK